VNNFFRETLGYAAASACALIVDMTALWLLVRFLALGYLVAATVSFLIGALVAYEISVRLAFRHHRLLDRRAELAAFIIIGAGGLGINTLVIFVCVDYFGLHFLFAKGIAAGFTFACNFIGRRQILFAPRSAI
jgi:putative flippase GtrA